MKYIAYIANYSTNLFLRRHKTKYLQIIYKIFQNDQYFLLSSRMPSPIAKTWMV